ncbi:glycosyltransferase family 4 protein [Photobacterium sp. DA100]|uniref:glycosyltransferase family 4 protein n=1 Tax=Photobacterium sp. DA100 TaxID=3027472 RepID=UPI00247AAEE7|nr:glycosyltransferase family 4 protein [Photobacterium sp. DA100]WEM42559.1 glycosyltransferase family 4 protein [Photobacterium sp. DA100]
MIYLIVDSSGFGGIESHIQQLAILLQSKQAELEVVYLQHYPSHPQYAELEQHHISYRFLSESSVTTFFRQLKADDIVHAHGYKASILSRFGRLLARYHLVTTFHAGEAVSGKLAFYEWLNRYTAAFSYNLAVSEKIKTDLPFRCELLRNFVHCQNANDSRNRHSTLQVGFVGRLSHEKAIDRFVFLCAQLPNIKCHVFGDGDQAGMLQGRPVIWHGAVPAMEPYWHLLDVLLITSRAEGMPMAALEAMAHGVVVLSTDVGEMPSLLEQECLVAEAHWQALAARVKELDNAGDEAWQRLSKRQHQLVKNHYSGEACWQQLARIYRMV